MQAQYTADKRSVLVTTKDTAPGGRRTEKVGLPYDPELYDHMMEHGVHIAVRCPQRALLLLCLGACGRVSHPHCRFCGGALHG